MHAIFARSFLKTPNFSAKKFDFSSLIVYIILCSHYSNDGNLISIAKVCQNNRRLTKQSLKSKSTHYRSIWRRVFPMTTKLATTVRKCKKITKKETLKMAVVNAQNLSANAKALVHLKLFNTIQHRILL